MRVRLPDLSAVVRQDEGQYLERKSLWEQSPNGRRPRDRRAVRDQIAEYVAAFANAEGGTLLLGVEDDGTTTGHGYPDRAVDDLLAVPQLRLIPPLSPGSRVQHGEQELLVYVVDATPTAVMVIGDGFPYRINEQVVRMSELQINALKHQGVIESAEAQPVPGGCVLGLDENLIATAAEAAGLGEAQPAEYLVRRRLADRHGDELVLRLGALLLFATDPLTIENPEAAAIRRFRVRGTERRHGLRGNVEEVSPLEGNLPNLIRGAYDWLSPLIRKSSRLHDLFFREMPEYPTFAWQEAIVNAVAHRDYRVSTNCIEIWLFDDRLEVSSPGGLVESVTLEALTTRQRVHASRNPRINRVLSELGLMRRQGEGIPRMIEEMEASWLPLPEFAVEHGQFRLRLRNTPVLEGADPAWAAAVQALDLPVRQKRVLICFAGREFTNGDYRRLNQVDRDQAYRDVRNLLAHGFLCSNEARGRGARYEVVQTDRERADATRFPPVVQRLREHLATTGRLTNEVYRRITGASRDVAKRALAQMLAAHALERLGAKRGTVYIAGPRWDAWCSEQAELDEL